MFGRDAPIAGSGGGQFAHVSKSAKDSDPFGLQKFIDGVGITTGDVVGVQDNVQQVTTDSDTEIPEFLEEQNMAVSML